MCLASAESLRARLRRGALHGSTHGHTPSGPSEVFRREVGRRYCSFAWTINRSLWHVWGGGCPAQHYHSLWDGCADRTVGDDGLSRGACGAYAHYGLARQPAWAARRICPGRARHDSLDCPLWHLPECGIAHCLPHRTRVRRGFSDEPRHGDALRGFSPGAARVGYGTVSHGGCSRTYARTVRRRLSGRTV